MQENLQSRILHLPASGPSDRSPLSADVYAIRGETAWWIFDVGACDEAADFIDGLPCEAAVQSSSAQPLKKNIVISHFHRDHAFNLSRVKFDNLYVGRETYRHCDETLRARNGVMVVESPMEFDDGMRVRVAPIPNSHAKGSLIMAVCAPEAADAYAFLGDSTYPTVGHGRPDSYNVQVLLEQIKFLRDYDARYFYMSHRRFIPKEKNSILQVLESYYAMREPNKNLIELSR